MRNGELYRTLACDVYKTTIPFDVAKNMFTLARYFSNKDDMIQTVEIFRK